MSRHHLIAMADYRPQETCWLWPNRIPRGSISLIEGDPGRGKSTVIYDLAGRITTGRPMPDSVASLMPGNVVLLQGEDTLGTTQRNLQAAGTDLARVFALDRSRQGTGTPLAFPDDIDFLADQVRERSADLVVIDPVAAFLRVNIHNDQAVRKALSPLIALAEETGAAIVLVRHLTKSGGTNPLYRGAGSIGLIAAARSVLLVATAPSDPNQRIVAQSKSSLAPSAMSLAFQLVSRGDGVVVNWLGPVQLTAEELLDTGHGASCSELNEAVYVLYSLLGDGPVLASVAKSAAAEAGISDRTLRRAKALLRVNSQRKGFGPGSRFFWEMPPKSEIVQRLRERDLDALADCLFNGDGLSLKSSSPQPESHTDEKAEPPGKATDDEDGNGSSSVEP